MSRVVGVLRVLLTNDDGIDAEGLQALRRALVALDDIQLAVMAPDANSSATARSITFRRPLWVAEVPFEDGTVGYACDGTPVDCVRLAALGLIEGFEPDVIVSGINHGANLGDDITYSGTVAAALEGILLGIPGVAISQQSTRREMDFRLGHMFDFDNAAAFTAQVVDRLDDVPLPAGTLLNINVPAGEIRGRRGRAARQADLPGPAGPDRGGHGGRKLYRVYGDSPTHDDEPGTDLAAVAAGKIAVTPLHFDLTAEHGMEELREYDLARSCWGSSDAGRAGGGAARAARLPRPPLLRPRRPRDRRRRLRRAAGRAARDRARPPGAGHARLADPAGGRRAGLEARQGHAPAADAVARQRALRGGAARVGGPDAQPPRARGDRRAGVRVRGRAEDRRAGDLAGLRGRRAGPRRDPRQRRGRRGRHAQPAHDPVDPAADRRRAAAAGGARRGLHVAAGLHRAERAARLAGPLHLHEPAQQRRGDDPPARSRARRRAAAVDVVLRDRGHRPRWRRTGRRWSGCASTASGSTATSRSWPPRTRSSRSACTGRSAAARSTSRSTASW